MLHVASAGHSCPFRSDEGEGFSRHAAVATPHARLAVSDVSPARSAREGDGAPFSAASDLSARIPLAGTRGAARRAITAFYPASGRAFDRHLVFASRSIGASSPYRLVAPPVWAARRRRLVSQLLAGGHSTPLAEPRRRPGPRCAKPGARAPHRPRTGISPYRRPRKAFRRCRLCAFHSSRITTPHEAPLAGRGWRHIRMR